MGQWMTLAIMVTLAVAGFVALAAIGQVGQLPPLMQGTSWTAANRASSYLSIALLAISIGLILTLIRQKSALFLWLSLALAAVLLANVLSLAGGGRYTVGWFAGRLSWAASAGVLFLFFMAQFAAQQRRLAHARDTLEQRVAERTRALSLEIAERRSVEERQQVARARIEQLQSELLHASRLSTMGQMAGALAHELNQPLTAARNYLAALRRLGQVDTVPRQQLAEVTQRIDAQVVRLGEIIRHLREFVVKGESERRLETINAVIEAAAVLGLVESRHRGVRLSLRLAANVLPVQIDRVQIQQVVVNLVRNAAEAMDGLAVRELTIRTALRPEIRSIEITVSDTGPGIAPEIAPRLFQPFVSTKGSGRGLGLSICREIIAAHGGQLTVAANVPQGAVFSIVLPMAATGGATGASASEV
jgi:C4-dicarboxylate-specific signal transduction histidine kinase